MFYMLKHISKHRLNMGTIFFVKELFFSVYIDTYKDYHIYITNTSNVAYKYCVIVVVATVIADNCMHTFHWIVVYIRQYISKYIRKFRC